MLKRRELLTLLGKTAAGSALGVGSGVSASLAARAEPGTRVLRLGHWTSTSHPHHEFAVKFAELVHKKTNGALTIAIYPNEMLGTYVQQVDAQRHGKLDFSLPTSAALARVDPKILIVTLPYLFSNMRNVYAVLDSHVGANLTADLPQHGIRVLGLSTNGLRNITNAKRDVYEPRDLQGLRIRVPQNGVSVALLRTFGATPKPLPYGTVYHALRTGVVDGEENPFVNTYSGGFYKVTRHISMTRHQFEALALTISEATWTSLHPRTRHAVTESAREAVAFHRYRFDELDRRLSVDFKALGVRVVSPSLAAFHERSAPLATELTTLFDPNLVSAVQRRAHQA